MAGPLMLLSFANSEMFSLARLMLAGLFCVSLGAAALGQGNRWPRCRGADPDARIAGCTEIIARESRETKRNQIAAYINRNVGYRPRAISTARSPSSTRRCNSIQSRPAPLQSARRSIMPRAISTARWVIITRPLQHSQNPLRPSMAGLMANAPGLIAEKANSTRLWPISTKL